MPKRVPARTFITIAASLPLAQRIEAAAKLEERTVSAFVREAADDRAKRILRAATKQAALTGVTP